MLGNFSFFNPTRIYFGEDAFFFLNKELSQYGKNVLLTYGGGSIKKNGLYDQVIDYLRGCGKEIFELSGVMPNPTLEKVREGCGIIREYNVDLILAVGGGSVCDYAKAMSISAWCEEDFWERYFVRKEAVNNRVVPVGCILTMAGTGSEMNAGSVITNADTKRKVDVVFDERTFPKFCILNPKLTYTLPRRQMVAGIYDAFNHACEQYFSGTDDNTSDYFSEGLMRSLICSSRIALVNPQDYEARSNLMWSASWAMSKLLAKGKSADWMVHMIGQSIAAYTAATHGMTLSAISMAYYRHILPEGLAKFKRFAVSVWDVSAEGKTDMVVAKEGLSCMEAWMKELGLCMNIRELGVTEGMLEYIAEGSFVLSGGYKVLTQEEIVEILKESM